MERFQASKPRRKTRLICLDTGRPDRAGLGGAHWTVNRVWKTFHCRPGASRV
jgi:hypothetical protein